MAKDVDRLNDNVDQILKLGRLEDKRYKTELSKVDLFDWTEELLQKTPHLFESGDIEVDKKDNGKYDALIDKSLFEMLVMNLITNAFRYNDSSRPNLKISFEKRGRNLYVSFSDNGLGIDAKELKNIFKKFYQVGRSVKGSGLGLYLATIKIKVHKGTLRVESAGLEHGSCFIVNIPLEESSND